MSVWSILNGTLVNAGTVALGSCVGILLGPRLPQRYQRIVLDCLGLVTITLGIDASVLGMAATVKRYGGGIPTYGARLGMAMVGSLIVGSVIGTMLRLHERIEGLGAALHRRFAGAGDLTSTRFASGFLSASVIFCVGPLTLLGCLQNGSQDNPSLLYIKSFLDCFCSMALAAAMGLGVAFSVITVLVFQGGLAILAHFAAGGVPDLSQQMMNVVGGVILLATSMMILEIKKTPVADMLPAIFLPPMVIWIVERISPGLLMTHP